MFLLEKFSGLGDLHTIFQRKEAKPISSTREIAAAEWEKANNLVIVRDRDEQIIEFFMPDEQIGKLQVSAVINGERTSFSGQNEADAYGPFYKQGCEDGIFMANAPENVTLYRLTYFVDGQKGQPERSIDRWVLAGTAPQAPAEPPVWNLGW